MNRRLVIAVAFALLAALAAGAAGKQIKYATWRQEDKAVWDVLMAKFEKENPDIDVVMDYYNDTNVYYNTLSANIVAGTGLDVFDHHPNDQLYIKAADGVMADLSSLPFVKNLPTDSKNLVTYGGKVIGYNPGINLITLIYNKDILAQNNLKVPATFDDLVKTVKALKAKGYGGIAYLGSDVKAEWLSNMLGSTIMGPAGYKAFLEDMDKGKVKDVRDYPGVTAIFDTLKAINANQLLYDNSVSTTYAASLSLFAQKRTAFVMMGTWTFGTAANDYPGIPFAITPFPSLKGSKYYAEPAQVTCVFNGSKNVAAAKKWVEFLSRPDNAATYLNGVKWTPSMNGVTMSFDGANLLTAAVKQGVAVLMPAMTPNTQVWKQSLNQAYADVLFDGKDTGATMDGLNKFMAQVSAQLKG